VAVLGISALNARLCVAKPGAERLSLAFENHSGHHGAKGLCEWVVKALRAALKRRTIHEYLSSHQQWTWLVALPKELGNAVEVFQRRLAQLLREWSQDVRVLAGSELSLTVPVSAPTITNILDHVLRHARRPARRRRRRAGREAERKGGVSDAMPSGSAVVAEGSAHSSTRHSRGASDESRRSSRSHSDASSSRSNSPGALLRQSSTARARALSQDRVSSRLQGERKQSSEEAEGLAALRRDEELARRRQEAQQARRALAEREMDLSMLRASALMYEAQDIGATTMQYVEKSVTELQKAEKRPGLMRRAAAAFAGVWKGKRSKKATAKAGTKQPLSRRRSQKKEGERSRGGPPPRRVSASSRSRRGQRNAGTGPTHSRAAAAHSPEPSLSGGYAPPPPTVPSVPTVPPPPSDDAVAVEEDASFGDVLLSGGFMPSNAGGGGGGSGGGGGGAATGVAPASLSGGFVPHRASEDAAAATGEASALDGILSGGFMPNADANADANADVDADPFAGADADAFPGADADAFAGADADAFAGAGRGAGAGDSAAAARNEMTNSARTRLGSWGWAQHHRERETQYLPSHDSHGRKGEDGDDRSKPMPDVRFYKGGQILPSGGRAPRGGIWFDASDREPTTKPIATSATSSRMDDGLGRRKPHQHVQSGGSRSAKAGVEEHAAKPKPTAKPMVADSGPPAVPSGRARDTEEKKLLEGIVGAGFDQGQVGGGTTGAAGKLGRFGSARHSDSMAAASSAYSDLSHVAGAGKTMDESDEDSDDDEDEDDEDNGYDEFGSFPRPSPAMHEYDTPTWLSAGATPGDHYGPMSPSLAAARPGAGGSAYTDLGARPAGTTARPGEYVALGAAPARVHPSGGSEYTPLHGAGHNGAAAAEVDAIANTSVKGSAAAPNGVAAEARTRRTEHGLGSEPRHTATGHTVAGVDHRVWRQVDPTDNVLFSAYAAKAVCRTTVFPLSIWAFLRSQVRSTRCLLSLVVIAHGFVCTTVSADDGDARASHC